MDRTPKSIDRNLINGKMSAILRWEGETGKRQALFLNKGDIARIGRSEDNEVCIRDQRISRYHATVTWREGYFVITDLGSTNGTYLNGERVYQTARLKDSDIIRLDEKTITFYEVLPDEKELANIQSCHDTFIVRQDSAQPRLIITTGIHEGKEFILHPGKMIIGRATSKITFDISLQDKAISRPQAEIEHNENRFSIADLESVNGTLVNGELINERIELLDGDVIEIGETKMLFRAR